MNRDWEAYSALIEDLELAIEHVRGQYERNRRMTERAANSAGDSDAEEMATAAHRRYLGFMRTIRDELE